MLESGVIALKIVISDNEDMFQSVYSLILHCSI